MEWATNELAPKHVNSRLNNLFVNKATTAIETANLYELMCIM